MSVTRLFRRPPVAADLIDVQALIRQLTDAELLEAADAYFSILSVGSEQCRKPFSNVNDAIHITRHLSLLLQAAEIFRGADVLDFGCATGWLTLALSDLGCNAVGVDIAPSAVALAEAMKERHSAREGGSARFLAYDGQRLPLDDESVDRVVCFDAFHHVKDQAHVLREFARVLRPGGRVAMVEPGPNHSRTAQSQMEMSRYKVIENDVVMADIAAAAGQAGLSMPQMLVQFQQPLTVPFDVFDQWSRPAGLSRQDARRVVWNLQNEITDTQSFFIAKGEAPPDSRRAEALAAQLSLLSAEPVDPGGDVFELHFSIHNSGEASWVTEAGRIGQVNLGCQLVAADGTVIALDHGRFPLGPGEVAPGARVDLAVRVRLPDGPGPFLRFDLVSERVAWFEQLGRCQPVDWKYRA